MKTQIEFSDLLDKVYSHPDYVTGFAFSVDDIIFDRILNPNNYTQSEYEEAKYLVNKHRKEIDKNVTAYICKVIMNGDIFKEIDNIKNFIELG